MSQGKKMPIGVGCADTSSASIKAPLSVSRSQSLLSTGSAAIDHPVTPSLRSAPSSSSALSSSIPAPPTPSSSSSSSSSFLPSPIADASIPKSTVSHSLGDTIKRPKQHTHHTQERESEGNSPSPRGRTKEEKAKNTDDPTVLSLLSIDRGDSAEIGVHTGRYRPLRSHSSPQPSRPPTTPLSLSLQPLSPYSEDPSPCLHTPYPHFQYEPEPEFVDVPTPRATPIPPDH